MADLKKTARRFYEEVLVGGDLAVVEEIVDESYVEHEPFPGLGNDRAALREWVTMMRGAFPDLSVEIHAIGQDGDEVWVHSVMRGTHQGEIMGIPPTGRTIEVPTMDRVRTRDGKAVEHWGVTDSLVMLQQLGVVPEG